MHATFAMKKSRLPKDIADPIHLEIEVPPTTTEPARLHRVCLDAAKASLVRLVADHLHLPLADFLQAALDGRLTVEGVPLPAAKVAQWRQRTAKTLAKVSPAKRKRAEKVAVERGYASLLDLLTAEAWCDFEEVSVGIGHQRQRFPRTLWSRVEGFVGVQRPAHLVPMPTASALPQALAA